MVEVEGCGEVSLFVLFEQIDGPKRENLRGPLEVVVLGLCISPLCGCAEVLLGSVGGTSGDISELGL